MADADADDADADADVADADADAADADAHADDGSSAQGYSVRRAARDMKDMAAAIAVHEEFVSTLIGTSTAHVTFDATRLTKCGILKGVHDVAVSRNVMFVPYTPTSKDMCGGRTAMDDRGIVNLRIMRSGDKRTAIKVFLARQGPAKATIWGLQGAQYLTAVCSLLGQAIAPIRRVKIGLVDVKLKLGYCVHARRLCEMLGDGDNDAVVRELTRGQGHIVKVGSKDGKGGVTVQVFSGTMGKWNGCVVLKASGPASIPPLAARIAGMLKEHACDLVYKNI